MEHKQSSKELLLKRILGISLFIIFLALLIWVSFAIGTPLINTLFGDGTAEEFHAIVEQKPFLGRLIFVGVQVMQVFVAFIPGEVVEIAAGVVFGVWEGLLLSLLGVVIGSAIIFLLTKTLGLKFISLFVDPKKLNEFSFLKDESKLETLVFIIFFIPGTPKDLLTYFVGLTKMKFHVFMLIALFARIPSILTSTWCGNELIEGNYTKSIIIFVVTAFIGLISLFVYNRIVKRKNKNADETTESVGE